MSLEAFKTWLSHTARWLSLRLFSADLFWGPSLRKLYDRVIGCVQRHELFLIKGYVGSSNHTVAIFVEGPKEFVYSQARRVCGENHRVLMLGETFCWQNSLSDSYDADITMLCRPKQHRSKLEKSGYFLLPTVNFVLDLHGSIDDIVERMSGRRKKNIRKVGNYDYTYTLSRKNQKELNYFYWNMYVSYAKKRFQKGVHLEPYLKLRNHYERNGGIVFVKQGKEPISAILFSIERKIMHAKVSGTRGENCSLDSELAGQGALFFLVKWAKSQGLSKLDYGMTSPFLRDGLHVYKKEWGMGIERSGSFYYMKINRFDERTLSFLQQNPFIFMDQEIMTALVLIDREVTDVDMSRIVSAHTLQGLECLIIASHRALTHDKTTSDKGCSLPYSFSCVSEPMAKLLVGLRRQGFDISIFKLVREGSDTDQLIAVRVVHIMPSADQSG